MTATLQMCDWCQREHGRQSIDHVTALGKPQTLWVCGHCAKVIAKNLARTAAAKVEAAERRKAGLK